MRIWSANNKQFYLKWVYKIIFYLSLMQKLGQIQLQKTVTVKVECNLNDEIVVTNFKIIMDCLKDLNQNQCDMLSKFNQLSERVSAVENNSQNTFNNIKQSNEKGAQPQSSTGHDEDLLKLIKKLDNRTSQNQKNILDNIKDINLINKQISDLKDLISKLSAKDSNSVTDTSTKEKNGVGFDSITNINKEMQNNKQFIMKTSEDLDKLRKQLANMKQNFNKLIQGHTKHLSDIDSTLAKIGTGNASGQGGSQDLNKAQLNELRQKIAILNKKTNALQMKTDQLKNQTSTLTEGQQGLNNTCEDLRKEIENLKQQLKNINSNSKTGGSGDTKNKADLDELKQIKNELKQLRIEVDELKRQNNNHSKTSIEDDRRRGSLTQGGRFKDDLNLKDLITRVQYLEKVIGGSKNSIDDKNPDKLPLIKRPRAKDTNSHDKSSSKKEIADIKAEIQAWFNNYLAQNKNRDNFEELQLKIQQIRNNLNKKADNEGMKKGLTFLENKINQLYLFLTQPDGEDAMIVRKGFNCLSCSKKVEKLRGKIGPHVNWNNMTATNYSPPKVGYSRHMGQGSAQKDDNQQ